MLRALPLIALLLGEGASAPPTCEQSPECLARLVAPRLTRRDLYPLNPCCPNAIHHFMYCNAPKLMFCWIEKVGCTSFKYLFSIRDRLGAPAIRDRRPPKPEHAILRDPAWTKVAFYREPLSRFLSGYLDKCRGATRVYCRMVFGSTDTSFDEAVRSLVGRDKHAIDGHFRQQSDHCGGLGYGLAKNFTLHLLEPSTSRAKVGEMLRRANLETPRFDELFPPDPRGRRHTTDAHDKVASAYADPRHVGIVVDFFFDDYVTFQIALPDFAKQALLRLRGTAHALDELRLGTLLAIPKGTSR